MKVCPKCHSLYTDETLNFCLTDGSPLVEETSGGISRGTDSWQHAETVLDSRFHFSENPHRTSPNSSAPTLPVIDARTENLPRVQTSKTKVYPVLGALLLLLAALGGGFWWFSQNKKRAAIPAASRTDNAAPVAKAPVNITESQQAKVKKEIADFIESWRKSNEDRNIDSHIEHYANTVDNFYKESGISKNHVRADRQRAYEVYESIKMEIDNLKITPESETSAVAVFDKSWTFKNEKKTSTGSVEQEQRFVKQNGKWQIVGEKDLLVHFINNRVNQEANANPANAGNSANVSTVSNSNDRNAPKN